MKDIMSIPAQNIDILLQLEVLPNNKIIIPGCEPTSALSSIKLSSWLAQSGCADGALINLDDALAAIPGSYVKLGANFNRGNTRQKWFVLPARDTDCPCADQPDWYSVLKGLPKDEPPEETLNDWCGVVNNDFCPSPNFEDVKPPPQSPYRQEGEFPPGVGVLSPIPPWAKK